MALYVSVKRALKFPAVINAIPKPSVLWKRVKAGVTGVRLRQRALRRAASLARST
jgi:hypothetical protein